VFVEYVPRRGGIKVKGEEWSIAQFFDDSELRLIDRPPALPPIGTKLQTKRGLGEVVAHDDDLAVVNIRQGSALTSTRLTAKECDRLMTGGKS